MQRNKWHKSTRSGNNGQCVEVMATDCVVMVRDTKDNGSGPTLTFTHAEWDAFIVGARGGEFNISA